MAVIDLLPATRLGGWGGEGGSVEPYVQPTDSVVDVSAYREAAVVLTVLYVARSWYGGTIDVVLQTAIHNRDEHYVELATIKQLQLSSPPASYPDHTMIYLGGSSAGPSSAPGFARYLRVTVSGPESGWDVALWVRALVKP